MIETFKNRDSPSQSRKGKAGGGDSKKTKLFHTVTEPVSQVQSQCVPAGSAYHPPNVTGASAQSAPVNPSQKILPGKGDIRQVYSRPSGHPSPCVLEVPNRANTEGHGRTNMGSNSMVIKEHLAALQNTVDTRFELVKRISNPR